jgi:hypothetical protein
MVGARITRLFGFPPPCKAQACLPGSARMFVPAGLR